MQYKRISTTRGIYFVPWHPGTVDDFIRLERIGPQDILPVSPDEDRALVRELFLLACNHALGTCSRSDSLAQRLSSFARKLQVVQKNIRISVAG